MDPGPRDKSDIRNLQPNIDRTTMNSKLAFIVSRPGAYFSKSDILERGIDAPKRLTPIH
jgi:hypothetical protein